MKLRTKIKNIVEGVSQSMGASATFESVGNYPATINIPKHAELCANAASYGGWRK